MAYIAYPCDCGKDDVELKYMAEPAYGKCDSCGKTVEKEEFWKSYQEEYKRMNNG